MVVQPGVDRAREWTERDVELVIIWKGDGESSSQASE